jgi:flagellar hook protein FlgE
VNTVAFKGARTTFADSLAQLMLTGAASGAGVGGINGAQIGLGVTLGTIDNLMGPGAIQMTGNASDVAIQGDGWFRVGPGTPDPADPTIGTPGSSMLSYTRAGDFALSDQGYLVTAGGQYVIGRTAAAGTTDCYIQIPAGAGDVAIGPDGAVTFTPPAGYVAPPGLPAMVNGRATAGYLSLAKFANEGGLERVSNNLWRAGVNAGSETVGTPGQDGVFGTVASGALEMSNVDLASEFTAMIVAQRGFQANARVISTADQLLEELVNLLR